MRTAFVFYDAISEQDSFSGISDILGPIHDFEHERCPSIKVKWTSLLCLCFEKDPTRQFHHCLQLHLVLNLWSSNAWSRDLV